MKNRLKEGKALTNEEIYGIIVAYIDSLLSTSIREMRDNASFEKPAWSEYQAHQLGLQKGLMKLREFLPTSDQGALK